MKNEKNPVFLATFLNRTQPYSTRPLAEKALALSINKTQKNGLDKNTLNAFNRCLSHEDFRGCITVFNQFSQETRYGNTLYQATIEVFPFDLDMLV
jgi:hypothetical protein